MILDTTIEILINRGNLPFFSKIVENISFGDIIKIDINKLSKGSNIEINAICDICNKEKKLKYSLYNKSIKNNLKFACCKKCAFIRNQEKLIIEYGVKNIAQVPDVKEKIKKTNLEKYNNETYFGSEIGTEKNKDIFIEKYGVDNPLKSEHIKDKINKTNLEKYGVKCNLSSKEIRNKIEKTNLEKYGFKQPSKNESVKKKALETNLERYGNICPLGNLEIYNKSKEMLFNNWGVDYPQKNLDIQSKTKKTNLERYGVEYLTQNNDILEKIKNNNIDKFGKPHIYQSDDFRKDFLICKDSNYIKYLDGGVSLFKCDKHNHEFEIHKDNYFSRIKNNISLCTVCYPIGDAKSIMEIELYDYIKSIYSGDIIQSYRDKFEIDIYLPELNIGFEFNGIYWHSEKYKEKNYHLNKTNYFKDKNIRIIHIWEDDWKYKRDILKNQILNWLNLNNNKIYARKCVVKEINDVKLVRDFLDNNHIQGFVNSNIKIGLYYNDKLISLMTFDKFEGRKKMPIDEWNLSRFVSNTTVIGGASKLLKYFIKQYNPKRIISYADKDWSVGNLYYGLGFNNIFESKPDYKYIIEDKRVHKSKLKKSKTGLSESKLNLPKIWDCGKIKFELIIKGV